jgi:hypothetical protein
MRGNSSIGLMRSGRSGRWQAKVLFIRSAVENPQLVALANGREYGGEIVVGRRVPEVRGRDATRGGLFCGLGAAKRGEANPNTTIGPSIDTTFYQFYSPEKL